MRTDLRFRATRPDLRSQRGTASVEFVLVAPFLLLVLMLAYNSGVLSFAFIDESVGLRRSANYGAAGYPLGSIPASVACNTVDNNDHYAAGFVSCRSRIVTADGRIVRNMERAGNQAVDGLLGYVAPNPVTGITQVIRDDDPPVTTQAFSELRYRAWGGWAGEAFGTVTWERDYSLSANRSWELRDLPAGYNRFLHRQLGSADGLFPTVFARRD